MSGTFILSVTKQPICTLNMDAQKSDIYHITKCTYELYNYKYFALVAVFFMYRMKTLK
jgi:hypothetical protein